jgi:integrase/recombinase XerD
VRGTCCPWTRRRRRANLRRVVPSGPRSLHRAVELYILDMRSGGRLNGSNSLDAYRRVLGCHQEDVSDRPPTSTTREDVKITLRRWEHPNSQRQAHAILTSFYDWTMHEGVRDTNPARMVKRARPRPTSVFRPTRDEVIRLLDASLPNRRERWVIHIGLLTGARCQEMRLMQARHFGRPGIVWITGDIAKGGRERLIPVLRELEPIVGEIQAELRGGWYMVPSTQRGGRGARPIRELHTKPISASGLHRLVKRVGHKAGLAHEIGPHTLRHAFGDHVARQAGLRAAQALLGHASVATTESVYTGRVTRDELAASVDGFRFRVPPAGEPDVEGGC